MLIKVSDDGTRDPFGARLVMGMFELRDLAIMGNSNPSNSTITKENFDRLYDPLLNAMRATRDAARQITSLVADYQQSIRTGTILSWNSSSFSVNKTIDDPVRQLTGQLLDQGTLATKDYLQTILREIFGLDLGFLYQKQTTFQIGLLKLEENHQEVLSNYLRNIRREWSDAFLTLRNSRHEGWQLERIQYESYGTKKVQAVLPRIGKLPVDEFMRRSANRILLFAENMIAYGVQRRLTAGIQLAEIPHVQRDPSSCRRFVAVPSFRVAIPWQLTYSDEQDFV